MVSAARGFVFASLTAALSLACVGTDLTVVETCDSHGQAGETDDDSDDGDSDSDDADAGDTEGGETDGETDGGETDGGETDGEPAGCAAHSSVEGCMAQPGCTPTFGHALVDEGPSWCSDETLLYLGCVSTLDMCPHFDPECDPCPGGDKVLCDEDGDVWLANGCVPEGFEHCPAPGPISGDC